MLIKTSSKSLIDQKLPNIMKLALGHFPLNQSQVLINLKCYD